MKHLLPYALGISALGITFADAVTLTAQAQQYGPRKFMPAPSEINAVSAQIIHSDSNTVLGGNIVYPNLDIQSTALVFSYIRNFDLGDTAGQVVVTQPFAFADVGVEAGNFGVNRENNGLVDTQVELRVGVLNSPALSLEEFVPYYLGPENPDVVMKGVVGVSMPTGDYSSSRVVNLGENRWRFRAALPTTINFGPNWAPGNRTTLEIIPQIDVFTDNNDPPFSDSRFGSEFSSQDPIYRLESHLTQDLGEQFYISLDAYYVGGGATSSDRGGNDNAQSWLGLGGTIGATLWEGGTLEFSYGGVVAGNDNSPDGEQFRFFLLQAF